MRPIVSYDDISLPMTTEVSPSRLQDSQPPPSKKQKKSNQKLEEVEDSRELTNDEIWDDSALIDAWNAATEEYEVRPIFWSLEVHLTNNIFTDVPRI
jgi:hypothetical protein